MSDRGENQEQGQGGRPEAAATGGVREPTAPEPWAAPVALAVVPAATAFPVEVLPERLQEFVRGVQQALACPADYAGLPLLVLAGAAIGANRVLEIKPGWRERPCLFGALVGRPKNSGSVCPALRARLRRPNTRRPPAGLLLAGFNLGRIKWKPALRVLERLRACRREGVRLMARIHVLLLRAHKCLPFSEQPLWCRLPTGRYKTILPDRCLVGETESLSTSGPSRPRYRDQPDQIGLAPGKAELTITQIESLSNGHDHWRGHSLPFRDWLVAARMSFLAAVIGGMLLVIPVSARRSATVPIAGLSVQRERGVCQ
jgi:hypothetical protein